MIVGKCLKCNGQLEHYEIPVIEKCTECGVREKTRIVCKEGHYLCNACASKQSIEKIYAHMFDYVDTNPLDIAEKLIVKCGICGNSPHPIATAAFLVAYMNMTNKITKEEVLEGVMRATQIPGGWCGYYGTCGAAVGTGVAFAIIQKSTPMCDKERTIANIATSKALEKVAEQGGPRCCTSSIRVSIEIGIKVAKEHLDIVFPTQNQKLKKCWVSNSNEECKKERCKYYGM